MNSAVYVAITILVLALAQPAAARPHDPETFEHPRRACASAEMMDASGRKVCRPLPSDGTASRYISWNPREVSDLLGNARNAVTGAGTMRFRLDMQTTMTNVRGGTWDSESILTGEYTAPDRLLGILIITNPWTQTQSRVVVSSGQARVSHPQTGQWEEGLKLATSYYPVIFTGCLLRMAEADMDSLELVGTEMLNGERVYHLRGPGGARDELEIEYWLGVEDGLPRRASARTGERPGWSDEVHTIRITARLHLL